MRVRTILLGLSVLLLNGCEKLPGLDFSPGPKAADPAPEAVRPDAKRFRVGDRYTFDNPVTSWQVVAIEGDKVFWRGSNGGRQVTGFNPLLPARQWWSKQGGAGRRNIRDREGALFPMKVGAEMRFRATVTSNKPPFGWEYTWSCRVTGREAVEMLDETFETFIVVCGREEADELTFNYAPKVGHYVVQRVAATADSPARTRRLLAYERGAAPNVAKSTLAVEESPALSTSEPSKPVAKAASQKAEAAARQKAEAAERQKAEAAERQKAEAAERQKTETAARQMAEAAVRQKAETAARQKAEAAARQKAEAAARQKAETAARQKSETAARQRAEAAKRQQAEAAARIQPDAATPTVQNALDSVSLRTPDFGGSIAPKPRKMASTSIQSSRIATTQAKARKPAISLPAPLPRVVKVAPSRTAVPPPPRLRVSKTKPLKPASPPPPLRPRVSKSTPQRPAVPPPPKLVVKAPQAVPPPLTGPRLGAVATTSLRSRPVPPPPVAIPSVPPPPVAIPSVPPVPAPREPTVRDNQIDGGLRVAAAAPAGVHLASYQDAANARQGWEQLARRNGALLRGLRADIRRVDVAGKGVYYRLYAVPLASIAAAAELCRKLRQRGIFCEPESS